MKKEIESDVENMFSHGLDLSLQDLKLVFGSENIVIHFRTLAIFLPRQSHVDVGSGFESEPMIRDVRFNITLAVIRAQNQVLKNKTFLRLALKKSFCKLPCPRMILDDLCRRHLGFCVPNVP